MSAAPMIPKRALLRKNFWKDHEREIGAIVRGEAELVWTPVGLWAKRRKTAEPNGSGVVP